jgi:phage-related protein
MFDNLVTVVAGGLGTAWNTVSSWCNNVGSAIVGAVSGAVSSASSALQGFASSVWDAMGSAWSGITGFIGSICFAHAIGAAVESSRKDLGAWVGIVGTSMDKAKEHVQGFIVNMKDVGLDVNAKVPEPVGMGTMIVPPTVSRPPQIVINGPLVEIRDSMIDRPMVEVIKKEVERILENVLVEPSSSSGLSTHKRVRSS